MQFFLQLFYEMSLSAEEVLFIFFKKALRGASISNKDIYTKRHGG